MTVDAVIIGLGYVGLPLAREASNAGLSVLGLDADSGTVDALNAGRSHVDDLSDAAVGSMLRAGFRATTDESEIASATTVVVCVPTPLALDGGPDLGAVRRAASAISRHLRPGMLVVLESTSYLGTTDEVVRPILEATGLAAGVDFTWLSRLSVLIRATPDSGLHNTPKVVGGYTPECTERASRFYAKFVQTIVRTKGTREAETAKLLENTYRHINIALVNEMAMFCQQLGIDLWDVIDAASTKPFGFQAFRPGPGVGGHCIPIDSNYLSHSVRAKLGYPFKLVELAQEINSAMPAYVAQRARRILNDGGTAVNGASVLLLGVTYASGGRDRASGLVRRCWRGPGFL